MSVSLEPLAAGNASDLDLSMIFQRSLNSLDLSNASDLLLSMGKKQGFRGQVVCPGWHVRFPRATGHVRPGSMGKKQGSKAKLSARVGTSVSRGREGSTWGYEDL